MRKDTCNGASVVRDQARRPPRIWRLSGSLAALGAACVAGIGVARAEEPEDLNALLSEAIVSTPSRNSETATTAPATSSVVTSSDIQRWGIRSLDEAINYLALGMVTTNPLHAVEIGARGVLLTSDFGAHVLVLLDGHPLNESWNGTAYFERGVGVPLEMIDHIEVVLGPGSVMYGSQAMLGVIHVVTKHARDYGGVRLMAEGGLGLPAHHSGSLITPSLKSSYVERLGRSYRVAAGVGHEFSLFGEPARLTLQLDYYRQDGPSFEFGPQPVGEDAITGMPKDFGPYGTPGVWGGVTKRSYYTEVPAAYGRLLWNNLTLSVRGAIYKRATPYIDSMVNIVGDFDDPKNREIDSWANFSLEYRRTLSSLLDLSARTYADLYSYHWFNETSAAEDCFAGSLSGCTQELRAEGNKLGVESQLSFSWLPELRLSSLLGVDAKIRPISSDLDVLDRATGAPADIQADYSHSDVALAVYAEQRISPQDWLDMNVGLRWDYDERAVSSALSPRSAIGMSLWDQARLKLIYSEAFRAPSAYELDYSNPVYQITPDQLDAETVRSVEASIEQRWGSQRVLLGGFRSWWVDMVSLATIDETALAAAIARGDLVDGTTEAYQYRNVAKIDNYGLNASFEGSLLGERLRYGLNGTLARSRVQPGDGTTEELTVGPSLFGNTRLSYGLGGSLPTLALAVQYQGRRPADRAFDGGFASTPYAPAHVDAKLTVSGVSPIPNLTYRISGTYAFARRSAYVIGPTQNAVDETSVPELGPVRRLHFFLGLEYRFDPGAP
jgi:outer membrane receptor for ferrienterochelin and colicins